MYIGNCFVKNLILKWKCWSSCKIINLQLFLTVIFFMHKTWFDFDVYDLCENYVTHSFKQLPPFKCINYLNAKDLFPDNFSKVVK